MKKFSELSDQAIYEALDDTHKEIVNLVKKYFKGAYGFPDTRFKTTPNKMPVLTVVTNGGKHTFNANDLNHMLTVKYGKGSNKSNHIRADYMQGTMNDWKKFLDDQGQQ